MGKRREDFKEWCYQVSIAFNQLLNALHGGGADEVICSRAWRNRHRNPYKWYVKAIDAFFSLFQPPGHCERAYENELARRHYPKNFLD